MKFPRLPARSTGLTARERRSLRRIEDAAVAEDPLLDVRLGLAASRSKRSIVRLRRKTKAFGRCVSCWVAVPLVGGICLMWCLLLGLSFAPSAPVAMLALVLVPCAFSVGMAIGRQRALQPSRAKRSSLTRFR